MQFALRKYKIFISCTMAILSASCNAGEEAKVSADATSRLRAAISVPQEEVYKTPLGEFVLRHSNGKTPGKLFLNGELVFTAHVDEPMAYNRSGVQSFDLWLAAIGAGGAFDTNGKTGPDFKITKMVVQEKSVTCQYRVLDFTGDKLWISPGFPEKAFEYHGCNEMTYTAWPKKGRLKGFGLFYFGDDPNLWEKDGYHGDTAGYNPIRKEVIEDVDIPPPPSTSVNGSGCMRSRRHDLAITAHLCGDL